MSVRSTLVTAWLIVATLGCAAARGTTSFDSKVYPASAVAMDRLLIIANRKNASWGDEMYRGLSEGLTRALEACHVTSMILQADSSDTDRSIAAIANAFHATATMAIVARGTQIVKAHGLGFAEKHHFELAIFDIRSGNVVWQARSVLDLGTPSAFDSDRRSGLKFGSNIVARLRDDGVLMGCAAPRELDSHRDRRDDRASAACEGPLVARGTART